MGVFTTALLFVALVGVAFAFTNRLVKRRLSKPELAYRVTAGTASGLLAFAGTFFITAWGFDPAVIQINLQQSLDPFRWLYWLLSALCFGGAQAFLLELLRSRLWTERALEEASPQGQPEERALEYVPLQKQEAERELGGMAVPEQAVKGALEDAPPQHEKKGPRVGVYTSPFEVFVKPSGGEAEVKKGKNPKVTARDLVVIVVLAVWVVVHFVVLMWAYRL